MLEITIPGTTFFDEELEEFIVLEGNLTLHLEHSLASLSKWESKWHKAFLGKDMKSDEESLDYVRCMTLGKPVEALRYTRITAAQMDEINAYIENSMTATWFTDHGAKPGRDIITAEIIYYWMVSHKIPLSTDKWHLNKLLTLIRVCNVKNSPGKKMKRRDTMSRQQALNAERRHKLGSSG